MSSRLSQMVILFIVLTAFTMLPFGNIKCYSLISDHISIIDKNTDEQEYPFIENKGQFLLSEDCNPDDVKYVAHFGNKYIYVKKNGISFVTFESNADSNTYNEIIQDMDFRDCNLNVRIIGEERSDDYINYYLPHCPKGILNVYKYKRIVYNNIYDNIDFVLYDNSNGELQYDFIVNPGGDPSEICLDVKGAEEIAMENGDLVIRSKFNGLTHIAPFSYQGIADSNNEIQSSFVINPDRSIGIRLSSYDKEKKLVIDPVIREWGTFFGGEFEDELRSIAFDNNNNIIACGFSASEYSISTSSAYQKDINGLADAIIIKLDNEGNRLWSTYYGGSELDMGAYIVIDSDDNIIISGSTLSNDVLGEGGYQENNNGSFDCFLAKFNSSGYRLWGTFYGGNKDDNPYVVDAIAYGKIVMDNNSNIFLSGITSSDDVIGESGWQPNRSNVYDCFLAKFDSNGNRVWGTYYGGDANDWLHDMELDYEGNIIIGGATNSTYTFASEGAWQVFETWIECVPSFLSKFDSKTGNRIWGTYFFEDGYITLLNDLDVDSEGNIFFVAQTDSRNLGIGKYKNKYNGEMDFLIGKFSNEGKPVWTSYMGGSGWDYSTDIQVNEKGGLYVCGISESADYPVRSAYQNQLNGFRDIVLMKYDTTGRYLWGTFYGGFSLIDDLTNDIAWSFDINDNNQVVMAGRTCSVEVFGFGGFQENYGSGDTDSWIAIFEEFAINIGEPYPDSVCPETEISIPFYLDRDLEDNIKIDAFIWDANGNYFDDILIGTITTNTSGTLIASIPRNIAPGNYFVSTTGADNFFPLQVNPLPLPEIIGSEYVCSKHIQPYTCNLPDNFTYKWESKYGEVQGSDNLRNLQINWSESGTDTLKLTVTNNLTGCSNTVESEIQVDIWDTEIVGKSLVCYGELEQTYILDIDGLHKEWSVIGGEIIEGANADTVRVQWYPSSNNSISVILTPLRGNCSDTVKMDVTVDEYPIPEPVIIGRFAVCDNETQEYYVADNGANSYAWHVEGGDIIGSSTNSRVTVQWSENVEASIFVEEKTPAGCSGIEKKTVYINCYGADIFGMVDVCVGGVYLYRTQHIPGTINLWAAKPGGNVLSQRIFDSVLVVWNETSTKLISLARRTVTQYQECNKFITKLINNSPERTILSIPIIEIDPKEQFEKTITIPIRIDEPGCLQYTGDQASVFAKIRIKKSMFLPITNIHQTYSDDEQGIWRTIEITAPIKSPLRGSHLFEIEGYALLGDTMETPIIADTLAWNGISVKSSVINGKLKLKNITELGGKRLLRKQKMSFLHVYPIPFSDELDLIIESREDTDVWIELYSILGEKVFSESLTLHSGIQDKKIKLNQPLSDGVYRIVLRDLNYTVSKNVLIKN